MTTTEMAAAPSERRRATAAVATVFIGSGLTFASWASRIPQVRDGLELSSSVLGAVLLAGAVGSLAALPTAGLVVHRLGTARTVFLLSLVCTSGLAVAGIGAAVGTPLVVVGLFLLGFGMGAWDVAMNVEAAAVEQVLQRSVMSRFHAGFSVGTVLGALGGAGMNALGVPVTVHLVAVACVVAVVVPWSTRSFLGPAVPDDVSETEEAVTERRHPLAAWTEARTLVIGLFVLTMAFTEGTGNDWLGVAAIDGYGSSDAVASLAYVVFLASMTVCRWFGASLLDRFGRVPVLRASAACALVGLLVVVFAPNLALAFPGIVLWGVGAALGFPVGMSAAADDPRYAAGRVSAVATIGYVAFLAGPALIGVLGDAVGVLRALLVTAALLVVGLLAAGATRPLAPAADERA